MENLILQALGTAEVDKISRIKAHTTFGKRLLNDLSEVYEMTTEHKNESSGCRLNIKRHYANNPSLYILIDENGLSLRGAILGYRICNRKAWELGWIIEKYNTCSGDTNFMSDVPQPHGWVTLKIDFSENSPNLMDIIKDITRLLDKESFSKRF